MTGKTLDTDCLNTVIIRYSGCSAVGSASGLGPGGRRFESCHPDKESLKNGFLGGFFLCFQAKVAGWAHRQSLGARQKVE